MARWIKVASVLFTQEKLRNTPGAQAAVLAQLQKEIDSLKGLNLDLVAFSEGVEAVAQKMTEAESVDQPGPVLQAYQRFATQLNCTIAGSVKIAEGNKVFNSIVFVVPDGSIKAVYHKTFLTQMEIDWGLTAGQGAVVVDTPAGRLGGAVCFDLNFPELCEEYHKLQPDIMIFPSMYHGGLAQNQWAYRCQSYFISALPFLGGGIIDPMGRPVALTDCYSPIAIASINLDRVMVHLDDNLVHFADIRRKYVGKITIDAPPNIGTALITSTSDDLCAMDVIKEFDLVLRDDYFAKARKANHESRVSK